MAQLVGHLARSMKPEVQSLPCSPPTEEEGAGRPKGQGCPQLQSESEANLGKPTWAKLRPLSQKPNKQTT